MTECDRSFKIRQFEDQDEHAIRALWEATGLTRSWNDSRADIRRKRAVQPELFLVGEHQGKLVASAMAGFDGHRGWVYYLAADPAVQRLGSARALLSVVEQKLASMGCPKLNSVRA